MHIQAQMYEEYKRILQRLDNGERLPCSGLSQPAAAPGDASQGPGSVAGGPPAVRCGRCGGPAKPLLFMGVQPDGCVCPTCNLYLDDAGQPLAKIY